LQKIHNNTVNTKLVAETIGVFLLLSIAAVGISKLPVSKGLIWLLYTPVLLFQGLWFYRFYIVGHEASHGKLFRDNKKRNDFWGSVILLPLMVPVTIYRKIHMFHHGFNRKDDHTSALDTFVIKGKASRVRVLYYYAVWYFSVFLGGFFIHSLISVLLFLFVPVSLSSRISPAFNNWTIRDQLQSVLLFALGVLLHVGVYLLLGSNIYLYTLGYPMLAFGWILSMLVYIFHYDTTVGSGVRYNVRSLHRVPVFSWVLMNFNEHATHHQYPNIPWYELPEKRTPLPDQYAAQNQHTWSFFRAIADQLKGPRIVNVPIENEQEETVHSSTQRG
jgi:fatty acid desaturase